SRDAWPGESVTSSVGGEGQAAGGDRQQALGRAWHSLVERSLQALDRLRLPGATVLPVAGAVVGLYGGLAARVFANLIRAWCAARRSWSTSPDRDPRPGSPFAFPWRTRTGTPSTC